LSVASSKPKRIGILAVALNAASTVAQANEGLSQEAERLAQHIDDGYVILPGARNPGPTTWAGRLATDRKGNSGSVRCRAR
jgi:hypothetical protein